jgi:hypothetical protein
MLAVTGWIACDMGIRMPISYFSTDAIPTSYVAHDTLVAQGTMTFMLMAIGLVEFTTGAALVQIAKGELTDREPGEFGLTGGFYKGKDAAYIKTMQTKEINNGRLAMLAFGGIATQTALGHETFPYM